MNNILAYQLLANQNEYPILINISSLRAQHYTHFKNMSLKQSGF